MMQKFDALNCAIRFVREQEIAEKINMLWREIGVRPDRLIINPVMQENYFPGESLDGGLVYGLRVFVDPDCPSDTVVICAPEPKY